MEPRPVSPIFKGKRILLADDHPTIRKGAMMILNEEFSGLEFGEASNGNEVFKHTKDSQWDMLILDMDMPGRNGLEVLKQLKDEGSKMPVLMFSMHPEAQVAVRAVRLGAAGYVTKDAAATELGNAARMILNGRKYITLTLAEQLAEQVENPQGKEPHQLLSDREYATLLLFAKGKTVSEIADELCLGVPTISTYRARILAKMNMKNNAELVNYAIRNNLV